MPTIATSISVLLIVIISLQICHSQINNFPQITDNINPFNPFVFSIENNFNEVNQLRQTLIDRRANDGFK